MPSLNTLLSAALPMYSLIHPYHVSGIEPDKIDQTSELTVFKAQLGSYSIQQDK